tara:strand:- start:170800 stop:172437 length:1638 start_codon:yes stop_codon:yes gene_type:complete
MAGAAVAERLIEEWRGRVRQAPRGKKTEVIKEIAKTSINPATGKPYDRATIYRMIDVTAGQKKCEREAEIPAEYIDLVAREKVEGGKMGVSKRYLTTDDAIENLEQAGLIPEGLLNRSTVDRRLREAGWNEQRGYERHEDHFVNEVHHFDMSRSEYFDSGINKAGEDIIRVDGRRGSWDYKNKEKAERKRLWVAGYIDSYSRAYLVRYFHTTGENIQTGTEALEFFWQREDELHPMVYPPQVLKFDQGSIGKYLLHHKTFQRDTGIRIELAASKNDRYADHQSQGKVERSFRTLWQKFELKLARQLQMKGVSEISLEELNALAHHYCTELLKKKHPLRAQTRGEVYLAGLRMREQIILKTSIWDLLFNETTRRVDAKRELSYKGTLYKAPDEVRRQRIYVFETNDGRIRGADLQRHFEFDLDPVDINNQTGSREHEATIQERLAKDEFTYDGSGLRLVGKQDEAPKPYTLPPIEHELEPETPFTQKEPVEVKQYFTDWEEAKIYICDVFDCRWSDFEDAAQQVFQSMFETKQLNKAAVNQIKNVS